MSKSQISVLSAWGVIVACVVLYISLDSLLPSEKSTREAALQATEETDGGDSPTASSMVGFKDLLVGRLVLTEVSVVAPGTMSGLVTQQVDPMRKQDQGAQTNLCAAILLARVGQYDEASTDITAVIDRVEADPKSAPPLFLKTARIVQRLIQQSADDAKHLAPSAATTITTEDARRVKENLGWYGEVILSTAQRDPNFEDALARSQFLLVGALVGFGFTVIIAGIGGFIWLVIVAIRFAQNTLANALREPSVSQGSLPWVFAAWFIAVMLIAVAVAIFGSRADRLSGGFALTIQIGAMFLPLLALALPTYWGKSWEQIRRDVGLHCGRGFWRECIYGVSVYATAIPLVAVGAVFAFILTFLVPQELTQASHPIQQAIAEGDASQRLLLLFIAAIAAPIVEEIMFRGVLFAHLRDLSRRWGRGLSFLFSALSSSLIFAAIHPQGIIFVPILGALAVAFCLARDMRGSLISCMVAHGINNALVVGLNIALAG